MLSLLVVGGVAGVEDGVCVLGGDGVGQRVAAVAAAAGLGAGTVRGGAPVVAHTVAYANKMSVKVGKLSDN